MLQTVHEVVQEEAFLYELFVSTRIDEFSLLGLPTQQLDALLLMQYEAQKRSYEHQYPQAKYEMIYSEGVCMGRIITDLQSQSVHLIDISLLPEHRGKGYGTQLIKRLQNIAMEKGLPVTLNVLQGNPAKRLYERCGFDVTAKALPYIAMKWESIVDTLN